MNLQFIRDWVYEIPISNALQEALLELLRILGSAIVSGVLAWVATQIQLLPPEFQSTATIVLTILIREWDKYKYVANTKGQIKGVENYGLLGF